MADWMHKEATWVLGKYTGSDWEGNPEGWKEGQPFPEWLDEQCKGGWEVFKISRSFGDHQFKSTWCIFRKKAE
jgi:hypothetical protein